MKVVLGLTPPEQELQEKGYQPRGYSLLWAVSYEAQTLMIGSITDTLLHHD